MNFDFSEDQIMIKDSAKKFLENECPKEKVRELKEDDKGHDPGLWSKMVELGWMGLILPEEYDGTALEFMDLVLLIEEMGKNILPGPFFATVALCSLPIMEYGTNEQKKEILPKIAYGEQIWTLASIEANGSYEADGVELKATLQDDYILEGAKIFVPYANVATHLLVVARTSEKQDPKDGVSIFIVDAKSPGIKIEVMPTAAHDKQCEVVFDNVKVPKGNVLGEIDQGWDVMEFIIERASLLKSAEMLGGAQTALETANAYAKERVQFDKPIGAFQAIQHKLAGMLVDVEGLRYLVYEAAWNVSSGSPSPMLAYMAKVKANEVYQRTCIQSVKVHGAIGFTEELDLSLYFLRTKSMEFALGDSGFHMEKIADELENYQPLFMGNASA